MRSGLTRPADAWGESDACDRAVEDFDGGLQLLPIGRAEGGNLAAERADAALAAGQEEFAACGRGGNAGASLVTGVRLPGGEAELDKGVNDAGHGGRADLLRAGQVAKGNRAAEDDHRKRGEPRSVQAAGVVFAAQTAQQVNGRRVDAVSELFRRG